MRRASLGLGLLLVPALAAAAPEVPAKVDEERYVLAPGKNEAILERLSRIASTLKNSRYSHATLVDEKAGRYEFDCSGLIAWVLRRTAPGAHGAVVSRAKNGRPLARDYYREIARTRPGPKSPRGWGRVERVADARPGDVIAWLKPADLRSPHTGHVGFLLSEPVPVPEVEGSYLVRIADASSFKHADDDRTASGRTGFGSGTILVVVDPATGAPAAYGWFGLRSRYVFETPIAIGRAMR